MTRESLLERFDLDYEDKEWILDFIKNHANIHDIFVKEDFVTKNNLKNFRSKYHEDYTENLIFGISDIKNSYFEIYNNEEYNRRIIFLESELKNFLFFGRKGD